MGKPSQLAYEQRRQERFRECMAEADKRHTSQEVEAAMKKSSLDAERITQAGWVRQGVLKLRR